MTYKRAAHEDIDLLIDFRKKAQIESGACPNNNIDSELREYFEKAISNASFVSWIASENGDAVSSCGMCFYQLLPSFSNPSGKIAYITTVYTVPEYRRKGLASQLLAKTIDEAKARGYFIVKLHSSDDGKPLYKKFGFIEANGYMDLRLQ